MGMKLNIIGCGNTGRTLAHLWSEEGTFEIGSILNRSLESARQAVDFIGAGRAVNSLDEMDAGAVFMIATPDSQIEESCRILSDSGLLTDGSIVFHCSGALSSEVLHSAYQQGAVIASVHPVKSFADPGLCVETFDGTCCGAEGNDEALNVLLPSFEAIGATTFVVNPEFKTLYHTASVMVCNYLTALLEVGVQTYAKAGLDKDTAMKVMQPIVQETVNNVFRMGTTNALTGPIARGDDNVVSKQIDALHDWYPQYANLYCDLGRVALHLSRQQGNASDAALAALSELLKTTPGNTDIKE
jgi:predicted short-subunit dehydrogenase-like oxidoreductase (DUF2520 family)